MNQPISEEQAILSTLSPAMRRAILAAKPEDPEPNFDNPADYCTGHETTRGDLMGASLYCQGERVCHQAREAYKDDREPDYDRLFVTIGADVTVGTVVALLGRGLVEHARSQSYREHELTERGMATYHALKALPVQDQVPAKSATRRQRERANLAFSAAMSAQNQARAEGHMQLAHAYAVAAALDSVAESGTVSPEVLRAIAAVFREA